MKMDVLFLHSREKGWEDRLERAREVLGDLKVIEGENTILGSFEKCFREAETDLFVMIDGDNIVFNEAREVLSQVDRPSIFKATNDFGVCYGHGGIKVLSKSLDLKQVFSEGYFLDVSVHLNMETRDEVLSHHDFCFSEFNEWKSIFRELLKLHLQEENNWYTKEMLASWLKSARPRAVYEDVLHFCATAGLYDYGRINEGDFIAELYARTKKVTLAAICKNEEDRVDRFAAQAARFDAVHVLDTGSTDGTVERLRSHGISVVPGVFEEIDYSAFRNTAQAGLSAADAIVWLDFDEVINDDFDLLQLKKEIFVQKEACKAFSIARTEHDDRFVSNMKRVFKVGDGRWKHRVHEEFYFDEAVDDGAVVAIRLTHDQNPSERKNDFYLELLENELEVDVEHAVFYLIFHLALERSDTDILRLAQSYASVIENMPIERFVLTALFILAARYRHLREVDYDLIERILAREANRSIYYRIVDTIVNTRDTVSHPFLARSLLAAMDQCENGDHREIAYISSAYDDGSVDRLRSRL